MKVSVCIPVYGVEKYIERCARSLFEQTMKDDIEFIFVDDCTPDKSIEILQNVLEEYPERKEQVKIIRHEVNKGLTGARNTALKVTSGDYIIHCDSDDWVDPDLYERMYIQAVTTQSDIVCCDMVLEQKRNKIIKSLRVSDIDSLFFNYFNTSVFNSLVNKLVTQKIALSPGIKAPSHITMAEDLLRTTQMLLKCNKISICSDVFYHYYCSNSNSVTLNLNRQTFDSEVAVAKIMNQVLPEKYQYLVRSLRGHVLFSALSTPEMECMEYFSLYKRKQYFGVLFASSLSLDKKLLVILSLLSYPLARWFCKLRLKMVRWVRTR